MDKPAQTLYEKYGGQPTVEKLVDYFYDHLVLQDNTVNQFFTKTDMKNQKKKQANFITFALGGAPKYTGKTMREAHKGMGIQPEHFQTIINHLVTTLKVHGVEQQDIEAVGAKLMALRPEILDQ